MLLGRVDLGRLDVVLLVPANVLVFLERLGVGRVYGHAGLPSYERPWRMQGPHAGALSSSLGDTRSGRYAIRDRDVTVCAPRGAGSDIPCDGEHMNHYVIVS
ncbi:hypothetical protein GCM10010340_41260 [Streptomyces griseoloalbus]|nr:hypothetical protein GCM10010340_41260 [Streptomyces albaduncus]